jgi:Divergent InlB B-repeat domain
MRFLSARKWPFWSRIAATSLVAVVLTACGGGSDDAVTDPPPSTSFELTINNSGPGVVTSQPVGIACGTACSASFAADTVVTLSATPATTATFSGWTGDCAGSANSCVVTMNQARTVGASFVPSAGQSNYTLSLTVSGTGTVGSAPAGINCPTVCSASFGANTTVTLTATPGAGQSFTGWTGACTGSASACVVSLNQARSVGATFAPTAGTSAVLSVSLTGNGSVASNPAGISCGSACTASFAIDTQVTLTATPAAGQIFSSWGGACSGSAATCGVQMSQARSVQAVFGQAPARAWGPATLLETSDDFNVMSQGTFADLNALVAVAPNGDAMAIWEQSDGQPDGSTKKVYSRRYIAGTGWQAAVNVPNLLVCDSCASAQGHLILESSGDAVWIQPNTTTRRFSPASGWGASFAPTLLSADISEPVKAANGDITVISSAGSSGVIVNTLPADSNQWGNWFRISDDTNFGVRIRSAKLALSADATALAVWEELNSGDGNYSVKAARYVPATGWGVPARIESVLTNVSARSVRVAMDAQGNGIAMWEQGSSLYHNVFRSTGGWQGEVAVEVNQMFGDIARIDLAMTSDGRALAVWTSGLSTPRSMQYSPATGWAAPETITGAAANGRVMRMDNSGRAVMLYKNFPAGGGTIDFDLLSRSLTLGESWSAATLVEQRVGDVKDIAKFSMNAAGQAVTIWGQNDIASDNIRNSLWSSVLP